MTTWRKLIAREMVNNRETWCDLVHCTLSGEELDVEFNGDFGSANGEPFTLWTQDKVYFPCCYDGAEWVASVSRHPDGNPTEHIGGGC